MARARSTLPLLPSLVLAFCALLALGVSIYASREIDQRLGVLGVLLVLTAGPVAFALLWNAGQRPSRGGVAPEGEGSNDAKLDQIASMVRSLSEHSAVSADSRRVLNRAADREVLRHAIEEDIAKHDWDAAMVLVKELADRCGYRQEAEEYRRRIERASSETFDREVHAAIAGLEQLILEKRWDLAFADAARIGRLYPDSPKVEKLREQVEAARESHKAELDRRFFVAAREGRVEEALELLKELDAFLTEVEAEPYREMARGVIGKARDNFGAEFKLAVQDRRWRQAADLGTRIIAEFPNSRMAAEIREVIDGIRERAGVSGEPEAAPA